MTFAQVYAANHLTKYVYWFLQNPEKFKSRMHSLAYGQAMAAAARDYQKVRSSTIPDPSRTGISGKRCLLWLTFDNLCSASHLAHKGVVYGFCNPVDEKRWEKPRVPRSCCAFCPCTKLQRHSLYSRTASSRTTLLMLCDLFCGAGNAGKRQRWTRHEFQGSGRR